MRIQTAHCTGHVRWYGSGQVKYSVLRMQVTLAHIGAAPAARDAFDAMTRQYLERCSKLGSGLGSGLARCAAQSFRSETAFLDWLARREGRTQPAAVLLDSRGKQMNSEEFASWIGARRDQGAQHIVFAIGPASGWSDDARRRAQLLMSFGPMTMAHALARVVLAEQLYRAFTILAGHPYHCGH